MPQGLNDRIPSLNSAFIAPLDDLLRVESAQRLVCVSHPPLILALTEPVQKVVPEALGARIQFLEGIGFIVSLDSLPKATGQSPGPANPRLCSGLESAGHGAAVLLQKLLRPRFGSHSNAPATRHPDVVTIIPVTIGIVLKIAKPHSHVLPRCGLVIGVLVPFTRRSGIEQTAEVFVKPMPVKDDPPVDLFGRPYASIGTHLIEFRARHPNVLGRLLTIEAARRQTVGKTRQLACAVRSKFLLREEGELSNIAVLY